MSFLIRYVLLAAEDMISTVFRCFTNLQKLRCYGWEEHVPMSASVLDGITRLSSLRCLGLDCEVSPPKTLHDV